MQLYNSFAVLVSGTSLSIVIKYTRLKPRLIKNLFPQKRLILVNLLGQEATLLNAVIMAVCRSLFNHDSKFYPLRTIGLQNNLVV